MENTKRMVLVDEKMLDVTSALQAKQDMSWNKPSDQTVKSNINKQMKSTLDDQSIPEDVKAKQYRQQLNRFLQTKRKLPTVNEFRTKRKLPTVTIRWTSSDRPSTSCWTSSDRSETARLWL
jgi:hypothetical protein